MSGSNGSLVPPPHQALHRVPGAGVAQPSWEGAVGAMSREPYTSLPPLSLCHPGDTIFVQKKFHTSVQQQLGRKVTGLGGGDEISLDSPGHIRPCLVPPPCSQGWLGRTPLSPSPHSQCFGIVSPPNTHRCRNLENFHATEVLFPEQDCEFLLGRGRADTAWPCDPPANQCQTGGANWEGSGELLEAAFPLIPLPINAAQPKSSGRQQPVPLHLLAPTEPQGQISRWQALGAVPWAMEWLQGQEGQWGQWQAGH